MKKAAHDAAFDRRYIDYGGMVCGIISQTRRESLSLVMGRGALF